ncbi:MAG: MFS transporter [Candidatus Bathyarchaeia archaeon]
MRLNTVLKFHFISELLTRELKVLFFANLVGAFGDGLYAYVLPYYMQDTIKASPVEVGILYAIANICVGVTLFAGGFLADRYDRKKILILNWAVWIPAPLIFAFAQHWTWMVPAMVLWGILFSQPTTTAYIVTSANRNKLTLSFTAISSAWSLGYVFSPALGGYLAQITGMQNVFIFASIFYAAAAVFLVFISKQPSRPIQDTPAQRHIVLELLRDRKLLKFSFFLAITMFTILLFRPFIPTFLADVYGYRNFEIGVLGSFFFLGSAVLGLLLGRVGDKTEKSHAFAAALILNAFSLLLLLLCGDFHILLATHVIIGTSYLAWPLMNAIIGSHAPEKSRAVWIATPQAISMLCAIFAPYVGGILYEMSPYYPFIFGLAITLFIALVAIARLHA